MKIKKILGCTCVSASIVILLAALVQRKDRWAPDMTGLDFPIEVKAESRTEGAGAPMWTVTVVLSRQYYSRERLDRLFYFFSRKHPEKSERLLVKVYTDIRKLGISGRPRFSE